MSERRAFLGLRKGLAESRVRSWAVVGTMSQLLLNMNIRNLGESLGRVGMDKPRNEKIG